ncbi:MAG: hypothetical protein NC120_13360 [Ruminococcus sp.]|nr:hypothetical protein [Ruminococcus sp.]
MNGIGVQSVFKQCDLTESTTFIDPSVLTDNVTGIRYVPFTRHKCNDTSVWAGINEYGVSFVAADSYIDSRKKDSCKSSERKNASVFEMYLEIIKSFKTAEEAVKMAKEFYENKIYADCTDPLTDILLISDSDNMYFIETVNKIVRIIHRTGGHFASTNHCRMFFEAAPYEENHSTYLRLDRAEKILQSNPNIKGIGELLRDSYYGETVWSVCRYANQGELENVSGSATSSGEIKEDMFYTQAAVIFTIEKTDADKPRVICEYVLNGNASEKGKGKVWRPFETALTESVDFIGIDQNYK